MISSGNRGDVVFMDQVKRRTRGFTGSSVVELLLGGKRHNSREIEKEHIERQRTGKRHNVAMEMDRTKQTKKQKLVLVVVGGGYETLKREGSKFSRVCANDSSADDSILGKLSKINYSASRSPPWRLSSYRPPVGR